MQKEHQHTLLSRAKAVITRYNYLLHETKTRFGDGMNDMGRVLRSLQDIVERIENGDPKVPRRKYEVLSRKSSSRDKEREERHESFGMIQINRVSGGRGHTRLFGSHISYHNNTIVIRVYRAVRAFSLSTERFFTDGRMPIVEIELSPAQFAEAITSLNAGAGLPCTIREVEGVHMEDLPDEHVPENQVIRNAFKEDVEGLRLDLQKQLEELDAILDKKRLNKADRSAIRSIVGNAVRLIDDHAPFVVRVFGESVAKTVTTAKAEVEAFVTNALVNAGMATFKEAKRIAGKTTKQLTTGDD